MRTRFRKMVAAARAEPRVELVRLLYRAGRVPAVATAVLVVLSPLLTLAFMLSYGRIVANVPAATAAAGSASAARTSVLTALTVLGCVFVAQHASTGARNVVAETLGRRVDRRVQTRMLEASLGPAGIAHLEDAAILDRIADTRSRTHGGSPGRAATALVQLAVNRLSVAPSFGLLLFFRWWLAIGVLASMIVVRRIMRTHILASVQARMAETSSLRRSHYFVDLALRPDAAKETRVFGLTRFLVDRYRGHHLDALRKVWAERRKGQRRLLLALAASGVANAAGYAIVVHAGASRAIGLGQLTVLVAAMNGMRGVLSLGNEDVDVERGAAILPVIIDLETQMRGRREAMDGERTAAEMPRVGVRFEGVRFRYPGSDRDVYDSLDLELRAGESLAVVGLNGAGKTTLVKLLARLYDPTEGRITVDGVDLRELDPRSWQQRVAAIFQDFTRYELPARDNVGFGSLAVAGDDEVLRRSADRSGALHIVEALPRGWDTVLSRRFTDGSDISGGEWQRIALARAVMAVEGGAGILVLDEPTANLDVRAEAEIYDRFLELTRGVTTVVISHRFSTVRRADRIVVIDEGRVVEDGSHTELVELGGHYARLFRLQAARFAESEPDSSGTEAGVA